MLLAPSRNWTHKECIAGCNDGNPIPRENFSKSQAGCKHSKCKDCIANKRGPVSIMSQKRKASNDAFRDAKKRAEDAEDKLAKAKVSGADDSKISALEKEVEIANADAEDKRLKSSNGKQKDRRNKSDAAALAAKERAENAKDKLAKAKVSGADDLKISALRKEKEAADADAEDARMNSHNGKQNDRRNESNDAAHDAKKRAEDVKDKLAKAKVSGADDLKISALEKEAKIANAAAEDARMNSANGKQNDRRNIKKFPSGFVLDKRTMYDGLSDLIANQKANSTQLSRRALKIGSIITNGLKNGKSIDDVVSDVNYSNML